MKFTLLILSLVSLSSAAMAGSVTTCTSKSGRTILVVRENDSKPAVATLITDGSPIVYNGSRGKSRALVNTHGAILETNGSARAELTIDGSMFEMSGKTAEAILDLRDESRALKESNQNYIKVSCTQRN